MIPSSGLFSLSILYPWSIGLVGGSRARPYVGPYANTRAKCLRAIKKREGRDGGGGFSGTPNSPSISHSWTGGRYTRAARRGGVCVRPLARSRLKLDGARRRVPVVRQQQTGEEVLSPLHLAVFYFFHSTPLTSTWRRLYPFRQPEDPQTQVHIESGSTVPCRCGETSERSARVIVNTISTLTNILIKSKLNYSARFN